MDEHGRWRIRPLPATRTEAMGMDGIYWEQEEARAKAGLPHDWVAVAARVERLRAVARAADRWQDAPRGNDGAAEDALFAALAALEPGDLPEEEPPTGAW